LPENTLRLLNGKSKDSSSDETTDEDVEPKFYDEKEEDEEEEVNEEEKRCVKNYKMLSAIEMTGMEGI